MILDIENRQGHRLHAVLELPPNGQARQYALLAHCFTCNSNFKAVRHIAQELTHHGFGVVRFDFTGLGRSAGEMADSHFSANVADLEDVSQYMTTHHQAPTLLIGHSLGGAAVLLAAARLDTVRAVATIGAPADVQHVKRLFADGIAAIESEGAAKVNIGGRPFRLTRQFLEDLRAQDLATVVNQLRKPLLIMHSPQDRTVDIENAATLYQRAFHPKSFVSLDGADHLLQNARDSHYAAQVIGAWASRYLDTPPAELPSTEGEQVVAHLDLAHGFATQISNGRHTCLADEPKSVGGEDQGLSPYELLNGALGACTAMTLKLYAERKQWPLREVYVYLSYEKRHADALRADSEHPERMGQIRKRIVLEGDLSQDQRQRLHEIAEKCPVNRTLQEGVDVVAEK